MGSAYVFNGFVHGAKLNASDRAAGDQFGYSVSLAGDTVLVGAPGRGNASGAVYVFTRSGAVWSQQAVLTSPVSTAGDQFGRSVALGQDVALIGAPGTGGSAGAAYVFTRSGTAWSQPSGITLPDSSPKQFGASVSLSGNTAVIGAPAQNSGTGAVYFFVNSGGVWSQQGSFVSDAETQLSSERRDPTQHGYICFPKRAGQGTGWGCPTFFRLPALTETRSPTRTTLR
jgi:hypothetical protein